jgi:ABC-2 type transport system permease protein
MTLREVEKTTENAMQRVYDATQELETLRIQAEAELDTLDAKETSSLEDEIKRLENKKLKEDGNESSVDVLALNSKKALLNNIKLQQQQRRNQKRQEFDNKRREQMRGIELDAENEIREIQKKFKLYAVFIPPIPPLLVGLTVWTRRRLREREGISKARRLK